MVVDFELIWTLYLHDLFQRRQHGPFLEGFLFDNLLFLINGIVRAPIRKILFVKYLSFRKIFRLDVTFLFIAFL